MKTSRQGLLLLAALVLLLAFSLFLRIWHLGNIPGVNGDEAWLGYKALRLVRGEPFTWKTQTGNLPNFFYFLPLAALHLFFAPSFVLLRAVAVASGVLALWLNWRLCRRVFDSCTAWFSTLLLAVLPVNIAYSRFGWEPSQTLLFSLPVMYFSLLATIEATRWRRWMTLAGSGVVAAFLVHPMNAILVVFPLAALAVQSCGLRASTSPLKQRLPVIAIVPITALCVSLLVLWKGAFLQARLQNWGGPQEIGAFFLGVLQLFSGTSTYRYIPGSVRDAVPFSDALAGVMLLLSAAIIIRQWRKEARVTADIVLVGALAIGVLGFWLLLGPAGVSPENARYALWMIAPGALLVARAFSILVASRPRWRGSLEGGAILLCALLLAGFWVQYFAFFLRTGGEADPTFRTGRREPKLAALQLILEKQDARPAGRKHQFVVASSDWWVYWPMRYYSLNVPRLTMLQGEEMNIPQNARLMSAALKSGDLWFAEFSSLQNTANLREGVRQGGVTFEEYSTAGFDGRPTITVFRLHKK